METPQNRKLSLFYTALTRVFRRYHEAETKAGDLASAGLGETSPRA